MEGLPPFDPTRDQLIKPVPKTEKVGDKPERREPPILKPIRPKDDPDEKKHLIDEYR